MMGPLGSWVPRAPLVFASPLLGVLAGCTSAEPCPEGFVDGEEGNCLESAIPGPEGDDDGPTRDCDERPREDQRPKMERPHPGDAHVATQEDADAFCAQWDSVDGNLVLGAFEQPGQPPPDPPTISDLGSMRCLRWVHGYLHVSRHEVLADVHLPQLWGTRGSFSMVLNPSITRLDLPVLRWIGGDLSVQNNGALQEVSLPELGHVGQNVFLIGNSALSADAAETFVSGLCPDAVGGSVEVLDNG